MQLHCRSCSTAFEAKYRHCLYCNKCREARRRDDCRRYRNRKKLGLMKYLLRSAKEVFFPSPKRCSQLTKEMNYE